MCRTRLLQSIFYNSSVSYKATPTLSLPTLRSPHLCQRRGHSTSPVPTHLLTLADLTSQQLNNLLLVALHQKYTYLHTAGPYPRPLEGCTLALLFSKRSTRTRVAAETSMTLLGGHTMFLGKDDIQLGVNESLRDTSIVISSMVDGILAREHGHEDVEVLAKYSHVPVINALSDRYHPTQILADLMTLHEDRTNRSDSYIAHRVATDKILPGINVAWVGDANNILYEMMVTFPKVGINLAAAMPKGYEPHPKVMEIAKNEATKAGTTLKFSETPEEAVKGADVIITDTWISMGQEAEKSKRLRDFAGYQVTMNLAQRGGANPNWKFMHCLPRKQEEVDDEVFYSSRSLVFPEAENRKWSMLAILLSVMKNRGF